MRGDGSWSPLSLSHMPCFHRPHLAYLTLVFSFLIQAHWREAPCNCDPAPIQRMAMGTKTRSEKEMGGHPQLANVEHGVTVLRTARIPKKTRQMPASASVGTPQAKTGSSYVRTKKFVMAVSVCNLGGSQLGVPGNRNCPGRLILFFGGASARSAEVFRAKGFSVLSAKPD